MVEVTLLVGSAFSLAAAGVYAFVGRHVSRRPGTGDARLAMQFFAVWWYGLAATTLAGGVLSIAAGLGLQDLALFVTWTHLNVLALCLALFGLLYYLVFLFTGSTRVLAPLAVFYVGFFALLVYVVNVGNPVGIEVGRWSHRLVYENNLAGTPLSILVLLLLLPQVIGALAYFTLYFRLRDPEQRYRVAIVSWAIIIWFSSSLLGFFGGLAQEDWWQIATRFLGLGAAFSVILAYYPPVGLRRRWAARAAAKPSSDAA